VTANRNFRFCAKKRLLKLKSQILTKIRAALHTAATASTASADIAESEELAENVTKVLDDRSIKASGLTTASQAGVAEAVVRCAFVGVGENGIGLADLFEFFFRVRIIGIAVGMKLQGELAIRALKLNLGNGASDPKYLVIIAF
jgi:hypothetical protein